MNKIKRIIFGLLTAIMLVTSALPAYAAVSDTGFSDVAANSWYADAVRYVNSNKLMSGTSATMFAPNQTMTRAMLAVVLYRAAGSPTVTGTDNFSDTAAGDYYANAVRWASENNMISGYGDRLFGTNDPVSRQQIATILWRYAGSPTADAGQAFADESAIASWASAAVNWARTNSMINGRTGNLFSPNDSATRAEVAMILRNYMTKGQAGTQTSNNGENKIVVVYFSATGNTAAVAKIISKTVDADLYEIVPEEPYTADDLDWTVPTNRVSKEHENAASRPAIEGGVKDLSKYDTVFLGYPIWWGEAPNIVRTFMESAKLSGKTIIPFCTSSSSELGFSAQTLQSFATDAVWLNGRRFSSNASESEVQEWVKGLNLDAGTSPAK